MNINVGSEARVVGTKRVSPQGSVAGLREWAGQDVLVVVPSRTPRFSRTPDDLLAWASKRAREAGRRALAEYHAFREEHLRSSVPGSDILLSWAPARTRPGIRRADAWVRASAQRIERRAEALLRN
jgi:hypothetical protein